MNVKKSFLVSNFTTSINFNSSFKDNKEDLNSVSLFNIKKTIKLSNVGFEEQFANIKTKCPACSCLDGSKDEEDKAAHTIYINKTTGESCFINQICIILYSTKLDVYNYSRQL